MSAGPGRRVPHARGRGGRARRPATRVEQLGRGLPRERCPCPGSGPAGGRTGGRHRPAHGSSFATPAVSGAAGLLASGQLLARGFADAPGVGAAILATATPCPPEGDQEGRRYLAGRLDVPRAHHLRPGGITAMDNSDLAHAPSESAGPEADRATSLSSRRAARARQPRSGRDPAAVPAPGWPGIGRAGGRAALVTRAAGSVPAVGGGAAGRAPVRRGCACGGRGARSVWVWLWRRRRWPADLCARHDRRRLPDRGSARRIRKDEPVQGRRRRRRQADRGAAKPV